MTFLGSASARLASWVRGARARGGLAVAAALALAAHGSSCSPNGGGGDGSIAELERLAFVRAGRSVLSANYRCGIQEPLLVDRFEVTRDLWRQVAGTWPDPGRLSDDLAQSSPERRDWPAFATFEEALNWAERRGMRLPAYDEWLFLAAGPSASYYPWGRQDRASVANDRELGMGRPVPVGCFEQGASWAGLYDLYGNVAEWVTGVPSGKSIIAGSPDEYLDLDPDQVAYSMGGSYLETSQALHLPSRGRYSNEHPQIFMRPFTRGVRGVELGLRCCVEAEAFLVERFASASVSGASADRLRAVGRSWGNEARPLLEGLRQRYPEAAAFTYLLEGAAGRG